MSIRSNGYAGEFRLFCDQSEPVIWHPNTIIYSGEDLIGKMVAGEIPGLNYVYLEFANGVSQGSITPPSTTDRSLGVGYYRGLTGNRDYLRLPIEISPRTDASDSNHTSNRVTFYAVSASNTGSRAIVGSVNPLTFSNADQSVIYGIAIAYAPVASDPTRDIVFCRGYPDADSQKAKPVSGQVTMMWRVAFNKD